ncbi:MAG: DUF4476 domain-containing protein [Ginsengibacter sp.]
MFTSCIRRLFFLALLSVVVFLCKAQQVHFVYLQTENGHPFYAKINNNLVSSSPEGYIIIPDLKDSTYQLVVGFPKNKFPEEKFTLTIDKKDEGFLLKNFDENGWQLFNLQTLALIQGTNENAIAKVEKKEADPFSSMLASVVKDSSILQDHEAAVSTPVKVDTPAAKEDIPTVKADNLSVATEKTPATVVPVSSTETKEGQSISMILNKADSEGLQRIYEDKTNGLDTIRIFFPPDKTVDNVVLDQNNAKEIIAKNVMPGETPANDNSKSEFTITPTEIPKVDSSNSPSVDERINILKQDSSNDNASSTDKTVLPLSEQMIENNKASLEKENNPQDLKTVTSDSKTNQKDQTLQQQDNVSARDRTGERIESQITLLPKEVTSTTVNSDCKEFATNEDFLKLRRKMASENNDENMIKVARKYFRSKCFSTEQIKDLSYLFLKDEGKYMFFDAAYPFTSDSDQYRTLKAQLKDEYYLNRFKAMIRK